MDIKYFDFALISADAYLGRMFHEIDSTYLLILILSLIHLFDFAGATRPDKQILCETNSNIVLVAPIE